MNVTIDYNKCIGCGQCSGLCPEVFVQTNEGRVTVVAETVPPDAVDFCIQTMELCPVEAILVSINANA